MVQPKSKASKQKPERRNSGSEDTGSRLSQRLRNRFTRCFVSTSPAPRQANHRAELRSVANESLCLDLLTPQRSAVCAPSMEDPPPLNLESLSCSSSNFEALLAECKKLRRKHKELTQDMQLMERRTTEITNNFCSIVSDNNKQLRYVLDWTQDMNRVVEDLRSQIQKRDQLIQELQESIAQRRTDAPQGADSTPRQKPEDHHHHHRND